MVRRRHRDPTGEGKLYLDSVLDMGSRRIVGFAIGEHHEAALSQAALQMAIAVRGGKPAVAGVIFHTDYAEPCVKPRNRSFACVGGVR